MNAEERVFLHQSLSLSFFIKLFGDFSAILGLFTIQRVLCKKGDIQVSDAKKMDKTLETKL